MANGNGFTAQDVISAIHDAKGFVSKAADILGVSRPTFYKYIDKYATAKQALEDVREARHDYVENKLIQQIEQGNITAIIFYLKTQCKHRGYIERQEVTGADGNAQRIVIEYDNAEIESPGAA